MRSVLRCLGLFLVVALAGCGQGESLWNFSKGQVAPVTAAKVSYYAASRFAEQVSFGPTPELIADIQARGFAGWIEHQYTLPASQIDPTPKIKALYGSNSDRDVFDWYRAQFPHLAVGAQDQLRLRVTWSLSQFLAVSDRRIFAISALEWANMLQRLSLTNYAQILDGVATSPAMGWYLDNAWNRPKSEQCPWCAPNENFAREFMQLFSIGIVELNLDGSPKKDLAGRLTETYTQRDVEQLARALTGWTWTDERPYEGDNAWTDWTKPMIPSKWEHDHDYGEKVVMGNRFPAGQGTRADLDQAVSMLMRHANTAPFVALRLIQNLVKSNPSPAYVTRVANVFRDNGFGVRGDMKSVVRAILLDPEARRGDDPRYAQATDGKVREPFQFQMALWRGLSCERSPTDIEGRARSYSGQQPFSPETVFSFYAPTDTASGTSIPAPEQRLLHEEEFKGRLGIRLDWSPVIRDDQNASKLSMEAAGCDTAGLLAAYRTSASAFSDYLAPRFFRGAFPATLRLEMARIHEHLQQQNYMQEFDQATSLLSYALISPYFGVSR